MTARPARWLALAAVAASVLVPLSVRAGAWPCADNPDKCYSFTVDYRPQTGDPSQPQPGQDAHYEGTLTNLSRGGSGVTLGSANVTWDPSDAFHSLTVGTVSPRGTIERVGDTLQLRNLGASPGTEVVFTFTAVALDPVTVRFHSTAKQANRYAGSGNDLTQVPPDPTVTIGDCSDVPTNGGGCGAVYKPEGGEVCTHPYDAHPDLAACEQVPGVQPAPGSAAYQQLALRVYTEGDGTCPVLPPECHFVVQLLRKLGTEYDTDHTGTLTITCGDLCAGLALYFQEDEDEGITEPLLPCLSTEEPLMASPLTGSLACYVDNGDGTITVYFISKANDYKVVN